MNNRVIIYHNRAAKIAIWMNDKYMYRASSRVEYDVMAAANNLVRNSSSEDEVYSVLQGISFMLKQQGTKR